MKKKLSKKRLSAVKSSNYELLLDNSKRASAFNGTAARKLDSAFDGGKVTLPSIEELEHLFTRLNNLYFSGKLKNAKLEYSNRMTCAGSYYPDDRVIKLSVKYHKIFPDEIEDTLKHEMIHIKHFHHDSDFRAEAKRIGASLKAKTHPLLLRKPKFLYICPGCGMQYPRQKRMHKYSCGDCSENKKYDPRFKLKLVRPDEM